MSGKKTIEKIDFADLRTIGEVATTLDLPAHVLRFWETRFRDIRPVKRAGGRRFYRPGDIVLLAAIRTLLYEEGYTIRGVQRLIREEGVDAIVTRAARRDAPETRETPAPDGIRAGPPHLLPEPGPPAPESPPLTETEASANLPGRARPTAAGLDRDARLRAALAEIDECRRLLALTRR